MSRLRRLFLSVGVALVGSSAVLAQSSPELIVPQEVRVDKPSRAMGLSPNIRNAATSLKMDPQQVHRASEALKLVYARDYRGARAAFAEIHRDHPELALGNVGRMLIFQCLMLENFDYRFERQYQAHASLAIRDLDAAMATPGNEAWEYFLRGGVLGIEAIHEMRKSNYVASMRKGLEALTALRALEETAPDFVDPDLGYGLFFYWRTVIGQTSSLIPEGEDRRAQGIAMIEQVEQKGAFVAPGASLALAYIYSEAGKPRKALAYSKRLHHRYPDNVINGLLRVRMLMRLRRYPAAQKAIDHILSVDTDNHRVHYYRATIHLRQNQLDEAHAAIDAFLGMPLEEAPKAYGLHRKADIFFRQKNYDQARVFYKKAVDLNGYSPSKRRLARIDQIEAEKAQR